MEPAAYAECVAAINTYHREHLQPLVVCSRTNEYETAAQRERLSLHTAIIVQPLSKEQIEAHLCKDRQASSSAPHCPQEEFHPTGIGNHAADVASATACVSRDFGTGAFPQGSPVARADLG